MTLSRQILYKQNKVHSPHTDQLSTTKIKHMSHEHNLPSAALLTVTEKNYECFQRHVNMVTQALHSQ